MSFKYQLKDAGFRSKRQFALYAGYAPNTVSNWGEKPPKLVKIHLELLTGLKAYTDRPVLKE